MEVKDVLAAAVQAVKDAEVPDDLRPAAFEKAIELIAGANRNQTSASAKIEGLNGSSRTDASSGTTLVERISERLKLQPDVVGEVYADLDGEVTIIVSPKKLTTSKSAGTKELALMLAAGRQAAGLEDFTPTKLIRDVAVEFKKFDSPNFATTLGTMSREFNYHGTGQSRAVKLSRVGWEDATDLVRRLGGGES